MRAATTHHVLSHFISVFPASISLFRAQKKKYDKRLTLLLLLFWKRNRKSIWLTTWCNDCWWFSVGIRSVFYTLVCASLIHDFRSTMKAVRLVIINKRSKEFNHTERIAIRIDNKAKPQQQQKQHHQPNRGGWGAGNEEKTANFMARPEEERKNEINEFMTINLIHENKHHTSTTLYYLMPCHAIPSNHDFSFSNSLELYCVHNGHLCLCHMRWRSLDSLWLLFV